jgi:fructokinase
MERGLTIVGLGEALFDVFPDREILGGAPLNVAVHAQQLASIVGGRGLPASRIGRDELGRRVTDELSARGVPTSGLQVDDEHPTGRVLVTLVGREPHYEIVPDAAWDHLAFNEDLERLAGECDAVCFGTLGQRSPEARATIGQFLGRATRAIRLFDVNLRQEFYSEALIRQSCALATAIKLNEHELPQIHRLLVEPGGAAASTESHDRMAGELRERLALDAVVLTRGAAGTVLYTAGGKTEGEPASYPHDPEADSVGAGDACSAGVLVGMLLGWPPARVVALANAAGAYVASQPGATPRFPARLLELVTREGTAKAAPGPEEERSKGEPRANP